MTNWPMTDCAPSPTIRRVKRIHVARTAELVGLVFALLSACRVALTVITWVAMLVFGAGAPIPASFTAGLFKIGSLAVAPIASSFVGYVAGGSVALLYNLVARWTGGIELDVAE